MDPCTVATPPDSFRRATGLGKECDVTGDDFETSLPASEAPAPQAAVSDAQVSFDFFVRTMFCIVSMQFCLKAYVAV